MLKRFALPLFVIFMLVCQLACGGSAATAAPAPTIAPAATEAPVATETPAITLSEENLMQKSKLEYVSYLVVRTDFTFDLGTWLPDDQKFQMRNGEPLAFDEVEAVYHTVTSSDLVNMDRIILLPTEQNGLWFTDQAGNKIWVEGSYFYATFLNNEGVEFKIQIDHNGMIVTSPWMGGYVYRDPFVK